MNRNFFERNTRATELRRTCLTGTAAYLAVIHGDDESVGTVLDVNQKLLAFGIVPNMHVISPGDPEEKAKQKRIMNNPVMAAEFACGQMLTHWQRAGLTAGPDRVVLAEHDQLVGQGEVVMSFDARTAPKPVMDLAVRLGMVSMMNSMLDSEAGY